MSDAAEPQGAVAGSSGDPGRVGPSRRGVVVLIAGIALIAALAIAGTAGWLIRGGPSTPSAGSVDAGFARDMATHHQQAVTMAGYTRDNTDNAQIKILAYDIETSQQFELGRMWGWLDGWDLPNTDPAHPPMSWMSGHAGHAEVDPATGLMPGLATPAQMDELESAKGTKLDTLFLQLMIHHHQGGLPMAQYAAAHATQQYVRDAAAKMVTNQSNEIISMEQMLRQLGGTELPPPAS